MEKTIEIKKLDKRLKEFPQYASENDAGMDVRACIKDSSMVIKPNESVLVPLGFSMHIADPNLVATLLPRSGSGHKHGLVLGNLVGVVDSDYKDQVYASVWNRNTDQAIEIKRGERIAQMVFLPIVRVQWEEVEEFSADNNRGGGFGHTGEE